MKVFFLLQLQDLAVSPAIRDPRLNTAECVIEGHKTDISAVGATRNIYFNNFMVLCLFYLGKLSFISERT